MTLPDRLSGLMARIEAGEPVTQADVDRLGLLQSLDLAKLGEDFARETIQREEAHTANLKTALEALNV